MTSTQEQDLVGDYVLDVNHTRLGFVAHHAMVTRVHGTFETFRGEVHIDLGDPSRSSAEVEIEAASVATGIGQRDAHLRTSDFLDAPHHPLINYRSAEISRVDRTTFQVLGNLTIRGVTRPLALDLRYHGATQDAEGDVRLAFTASAVISRRSYGVAFGTAAETGGIVIADNVTLELDVSLLRVLDTSTGADQPSSSAGPGS
jgi:polyisoprenoid-binding protein YceI